MRTKSFITLLLLAITFVMADGSVVLFSEHQLQEPVGDSTMVKDSLKGSSLLEKSKTEQISANTILDTLSMDSLQLAIYHHNKVIDDSIRLDSINKSKKSGIDAPVKYNATDSLVICFYIVAFYRSGSGFVYPFHIVNERDGFNIFSAGTDVICAGMLLFHYFTEFFASSILRCIGWLKALSVY